MTRRHRTRSAGIQLRSLYMWHRWIGLAAALFVVTLALTGLALNHTEELQLDASFVQSPALLDWYGIHAPENISSYTAGPLIISAVGNRIYNNTTQIPGIDAPLTGAVQLGEFIVVATNDSLLLFTVNGELVEQLGSGSGVPSDIQAVGTTTDNRLALRTTRGNLTTNSDFITWEKSGTARITWSRATQPGEALRTTLENSYRGNGLPLERLILDLHSGRILGNAGVYLMDAAAILCLLLAFSGVWLWGKRRTSARAHRRNIKADSGHPSP